ncbi:MAG TPA: fucose isomerase, partial [Phycisphaerae bacterium]
MPKPSARSTHKSVSHKLPSQKVFLLASGDLRPSANKVCTPAQLAMEALIIEAFASLGVMVHRAHPIDRDGHCFIDSQKYGMEVFRNIPPDAPLIVAEAVWQYSHHVLAGLRTHRGPILTVANFDGTWPGLVGLLGLNAGLTKMGREFSTIWSVDFTDRYFRDGIKSWVETGRIVHDDSHVRSLPDLPPSAESELGIALAEQLQREKAIIGVFDEGCMGMYNAIIDDELLNPLGIYKERLSQSALYAEMLRVPDHEAAAVR